MQDDSLQPTSLSSGSDQHSANESAELRMLRLLIIGLFITLPLASVMTIDLSFPLTIAHLFAAAIALTILWIDRFRPRLVTWLPASLFVAFCVTYTASFLVNLGADLPAYSWATGRNAPVIRSLTKVLWLFGNVTIALVLANAIRRTNAERTAVWAVAGGAVLASVYGLYQVVGGTHGFFVPFLPADGPGLGAPTQWIVLRAKGTFIEPNAYGAYLAAALPFAAVAWTRASVGASALLATALPLAVVVGGIIVSFALGGWLPSAIAALVLVFLTRGSAARAISLRLAGATLIAGAVTLVLVPDVPRAATALVFKGAISVGAVDTDATPAATTPSESTESPRTNEPEEFSAADAEISVSERTRMAGAALEMFAANPVAGVGPGNFGFIYPEIRPSGLRDPKQSVANNVYAEILAETGLVGSVAFAAGAIGLVVLASRAHRREQGDHRIEVAAGVAALAAMAAAAVMSSTFTLLYQWSIVGLVCAFVERSRLTFRPSVERVGRP